MASIKFQRPSLFRKDMDAVLQTMVDEKIGPGEKKKLFIKGCADYLSLKGGVALRTYPDAIALAINLFDLQAGDGVAISVFTPEIYYKTIKKLGLKPIVLDTDDEAMISGDEVSKHLGDIKLIILYEPVCQIPSSKSLKEFGIPIIEDITESVGSLLNEEKSGKIGDVVIFNTEEEALVSAAGGAIVLSNNSERIEQMKSSVNQYIEMSDLNAALGLMQITKLDDTTHRRNLLYERFKKASMKGGSKLFGSGSVDFFSNGYGFSVIVNEKPEDTIKFSEKYGVTAKKTFSGAVGSRYLDRYDLYPKSLGALQRAVSFPLYPFLSSTDIDTIEKVISHLR